MPQTETNLFAGLRKAAHSEARDMVRFCMEMISFDGRSVPESQRAWKIGRTFSWHYVRNVEFRTSQLIHNLENLTMAGKKGKQNAPTFVPFEFVRYELNAEDKKAAKIWIEENLSELGPKMHDIMGSDYKFSCSFSSDHDTFTATLSGKDDHHHNPRKCLTARHKDWTIAVMTLVYKHEVIFKGGVWESGVNDDDDGWA